MDWQNERYVRLYTRTTADLLAVGWEGRFVWYELLRHSDRAGVIDTGGDLGVLPELLRVPIPVFEIGFPRVVDRGGMIEVHATSIIIPNYEEANEARQSDAHRSRESRARRRDRARAKNVGDVVDKVENDTKRVAIETQNVSPATRSSHDASHDVTPCRAVPCLTGVSVPAAQEPLTLPGVGSEKVAKPKVVRWTGRKIRTDGETKQWTDRRFGEFAGDFVELCARLADSRHGGVAQSVLERFTGQLVELAGENFAAFRYGVEQIIELDDGFEYSGRPSKIVNYVKTCMTSYRPNGTSQRNPGRANSRGDLDSAAIQQLAITAAETDGQ